MFWCHHFSHNMVRILALISVAVNAETDSASMLQSTSRMQLSRQHDDTPGARIVQAMHKDEKHVCVSVSKGQIAPMAGYYKSVSGEGMDAKRGDKAPLAGTFCVEKNTLALVQRSFDLKDAREFDDALSGKGETKTTTTTTTAPHANAACTAAITAGLSDAVYNGFKNLPDIPAHENAKESLICATAENLFPKDDITCNANLTSLFHKMDILKDCAKCTNIWCDCESRGLLDASKTATEGKITNCAKYFGEEDLDETTSGKR